MRLRPLCSATTTLALALLVSTPLPARAAPPDAPPSAPAPTVVSARALEPLHADYPDGAHGDSVVLLEFIINADGTIRTVRVVEGQEPFTSAAMRASSRFRFAPATRDGKPINAKIRAEIRFTAPVPAPAPDPASATATASVPAPVAASGSASASASASAPPPPPPPIEVTVHGDQPVAPGVTTMSRAEVRLLPGAFGDPFRAVEA